MKAYGPGTAAWKALTVKKRQRVGVSSSFHCYVAAQNKKFFLMSRRGLRVLTQHVDVESDILYSIRVSDKMSYE